MYQKEQPKQSDNNEPLAFRGSFLMSPRVSIFRCTSGGYKPGNPKHVKGANPTDKKNYVLFSRN